MSNTLEASIDIDASPQDVWAIVADLQRMGEWSPQCKVMKVIGGTVREGAKTINVNRKGLLVWPTSSKVVRFEPNKSVAFRIAGEPHDLVLRTRADRYRHQSDRASRGSHRNV